MRFAILSRNRNLHSTRRLLQEAARAGVQVDTINPLECQLIVDRKHGGILIGNTPSPKYDAILPRIGASITDYGLAVVRQFETMGVYPINSSRAIAESRDKMRCLQILNQYGIQVPTTVLTRTQRSLKSLLDSVHGPPVVLKLIKGTQGVGVMLAQAQIGVSSILDTLWGMEEDVLIQRYIAEGAGRDYRAFVIGNRVYAAMMRTAPKGEFRSNIHRGGEGQLVRLPKKFERTAVRAAEVLGLEIAGVDLMESKNGPLVLEVNSSPGFEGIERATGLNIAGAMIRHMILLARKANRRKANRVRKTKRAVSKKGPSKRRAQRKLRPRRKSRSRR